jgi:penicillin G amidase
MTTDTVTPSLTRARPVWPKVVAVIVLLLVVAGAGLGSWLLSIARSPLPQLDGELRVSGLSAPVTVVRDQHGAPTIEAATFEDLFFAEGYVTAQDRLWQMDAMRRYAAGELAEILGEKYLEHDHEQRILGLRQVAQKSATMASARDRSYVEAYARGVNAYLESHRDRLPLEFRVLKYSPKPWTAEDSVLLGASMVQSLNHGYYEAALQKEKILGKLGLELTSDLYVNSSWHDHPPTTGPARLDQPDQDTIDSGSDDSVTRHRLAPELELPPALNDAQLRPGSNNWVVSGEHTVTGKPLLSNDMHLDHQMPNLWYEVHLQSGGFNVAGVSLPGVPFVIVGHNQRIGWGFTNVGPTVEDVYVEISNDQGAYLTPKGWIQPEHRQEVIHVKGKPDVTVDVKVTRHGPVITDLIPGEKRTLALRWTIYDGLNDPFFDVDSAQNWDEFLRAFSTWDAPSQNVMYADVDGHIGYHATGHIPIRAAGDGSLPVNGSDDAHEWTGYVPFDKLPNVYDPPWGVLGTANGRITSDGYPYSLSTEWDAPWRTERIYRVLQSGKKLSPPDLLALQTDVYSAFDRFCAERFVYALDHAKTISPRATQARDLMRDWDGRMTTDSAAATIETRARRELVRLLLEPKLGPAPEDYRANATSLTWKDYRWFMAPVWLENLLLKQPRRWLPDQYSDYDMILSAAVETAVSNPQSPGNLAQWKWGKASPLYIQNPILSNLPLVSRWTGPGLQEQSGGSYTVKQVGRGFGPSERLTIDYSNLDQSTLNLVTGESGNFLSPYYMDQWKAWYEGFTFPFPFSPEAVEKAQAHKLVLAPAS